MITWFEKHNKLSWTITIIGAIAIFYISSLTFEPSVPGTNILSMLYHILAFFFFSLFLLISLTKGKGKFLPFTLAILISIAYGISDEIHQFFVPGRYCGLFDVGLDSLGILFASMIYFISIKYRKNLKTL